MDSPLRLLLLLLLSEGLLPLAGWPRDMLLRAQDMSVGKKPHLRPYQRLIGQLIRWQYIARR